MEAEAKRARLTVLDWIGAVVASSGVLFCLQFPMAAPAFKKMFAEFGGPLPVITQLGLTWWFPVTLGLIPLSVLFVALLRPNTTIGRRRALIVAAFGFSFVSSGVCVFAMYAPIFAIAGAIK